MNSKTLHTNYIYSLIHAPKMDFIAFTLVETPIFIQETTPRLPFLRNHGGDLSMHYTTRNLLVLLHKLEIQP